MNAMRIKKHQQILVDARQTHEKCGFALPVCRPSIFVWFSSCHFAVKFRCIFTIDEQCSIMQLIEQKQMPLAHVTHACVFIVRLFASNKCILGHRRQLGKCDKLYACIFAFLNMYRALEPCSQHRIHSTSTIKETTDRNGQRMQRKCADRAKRHGKKSQQ